MTEMDILQGAVGAIVYQNYDNGYAILRLLCDDGQSATVVGTIPMPTVGERLMVTGKWKNHPSYGRQFEAEFLERLLPQSAQEIQSYLSGRVIKGIGPKTAAKIVLHFGEDTLHIMEREPHRLAEIAGISAVKDNSQYVLIEIVRNFRNEDALGTCCDTNVKCDPACVSSHYFDN